LTGSAAIVAATIIAASAAHKECSEENQERRKFKNSLFHINLSQQELFSTPQLREAL
jgi:hypothetical protein